MRWPECRLPLARRARSSVQFRRRCFQGSWLIFADLEIALVGVALLFHQPHAHLLGTRHARGFDAVVL